MADKKILDGAEFQNEHPKTVKFIIAKDPQLKGEPILVALNGRTFAIPRGTEQTMPYEIYEIVKNSLEQDEKTDDLIQILTNKG